MYLLRYSNHYHYLPIPGFFVDTGLSIVVEVPEDNKRAAKANDAMHYVLALTQSIDL